MESAGLTYREHLNAIRAEEPTPGRDGAANAVMNSQERLISTAYLAMIALVVAFLAATGLVSLLG